MRTAINGDNGVVGIALLARRIAMKTIVSALIALSVITSTAAPASAFDAKTFFEQVDRNQP
jgi:hypothetical protein